MLGPIPKCGFLSCIMLKDKIINKDINNPQIIEAIMSNAGRLYIPYFQVPIMDAQTIV
ncbi:hypothetical protein LSO10F_120032 [Candidatus Liberibacter solanacearum]